MDGIADGIRTTASQRRGSGSGCAHLDEIREVEAGTNGCEECLAQGMRWVHLRLCLSCGHVGCCMSSEGQHAMAHFRETGHPIVSSHEPGEVWRWCWPDEMEV
jgi:uncharacterized UBP type Zn finger protein